MKEFNPPEPQSFKGLLRKNYLRGQYGDKTRKMRNETVIEAYYRLLKEIKQLYSSLPDPIQRTVFERDRRNDQTCLESMHNFLTPHLLFNLSCDFDNKCWISYAFHDCPFENQLRKLLLDSCWSCMKEFNHKYGFSSYHKGVLRHQDKKYIYALDFPSSSVN